MKTGWQFSETTDSTKDDSVLVSALLSKMSAKILEIRAGQVGDCVRNLTVEFSREPYVDHTGKAFADLRLKCFWMDSDHD